MNDYENVDSSFSAIINAPIENIGLPAWAFDRQGILFDVYLAQPMSIARKESEAPLFAASIVRTALRN